MEFKHKAAISGLIGCMAAVSLVACNAPTIPTDEERYSRAVNAVPDDETAIYRPVCIDGVQYWDNDGGNGRVVFPRYDAMTRKVKTCHGAELP